MSGIKMLSLGGILAAAITILVPTHFFEHGASGSDEGAAPNADCVAIRRSLQEDFEDDSVSKGAAKDMTSITDCPVIVDPSLPIKLDVRSNSTRIAQGGVSGFFQSIADKHNVRVVLSNDPDGFSVLLPPVDKRHVLGKTN